MTLKLDMSKAYDKVEWSFLSCMIHRMGFAILGINLIMRCISTISYSVNLNGCHGSFFTPGKGLQ